MIDIIQTCDGCEATRELTDPKQAENAGWRLVTGLKNLCPECIHKALRGDQG